MPISDYLRELRRKIGHAPVMQPAVCVVIFDDARRVLLLRQKDDGRWHTVGGAIDPREEPGHAAMREAKEETGLDVTIERVAATYAGPEQTYPNGDHVWYTTIAFAARVRHGETPRVADDEGLELRFFALDALPPLNEWDRRAIHLAAADEAAAWFAR